MNQQQYFKLIVIFLVISSTSEDRLLENNHQGAQQQFLINIFEEKYEINQRDTLMDMPEDYCPPAQYYQFVNKKPTIEDKIISDPYKNPSQEYLDRVQENLKNRQRVCALRYTDSNKKMYELKNFQTREQAEVQGWIVTHQGVCGKCSTTKDLYVYLTRDLTKPVRACGLKYFYSDKKLIKCLLDLGFTKPCAIVWYWNTIHTKKQCGARCFWSYLIHQPYVINGQLNKCLQCDESKSGPIFKYESGRTRRNSGIKSQIDRPKDQIYNLTHCYY